MKTSRQAILAIFMLCSFAPAFSMNNPDTASKTYQVLADWFVSLKVMDRIKLRVAIEKCKDIDWSQVYEYVKPLVGK